MTIRILQPQLRRTSEVRYHSDLAPGRRFVFVGRVVDPACRLYIVGQQVDEVPADQVAPPGTGSVPDATLGSPERGKTMVAHAIDSCATVLRWLRGIDPSLPSRPLCASP